MFSIVLMNFTVSHSDAEGQSTGSPLEAAVGPYTRNDGELPGIFPRRDTVDLVMYSGLLNHPLLPKIRPRALCQLPLSCILYHPIAQAGLEPPVLLPQFSG